MKNERELVWITEDNNPVVIEHMTMPHLHNCITFLKNELADVTEKLDYLRAPLPDDCRLTEDAVIEVYVLKCRKLQIERWQGILDREVQHRQQEMNEGFSKILRRGAANDFDPFDKGLPSLLQRQAD